MAESKMVESKIAESKMAESNVAIQQNIFGPNLQFSFAPLLFLGSNFFWPHISLMPQDCVGHLASNQEGNKVTII